LNNKGQFSIIAALLVAIVLVASAMATYSSLRYSSTQEQPQILSSVDETDLALKQLLGFTVGYYGSVLKVTGNVTYARDLASNYLNNSLTNVGYVKPEWGLSLNVTDLNLNAAWFNSDSYSQGSMQVTYDLNGLGITGISYNASIRLEVKVLDSASTTQAQFKILTDRGEPLINLGTSNIKFYRYVFGDLTWEYTVPTTVISHVDGTYIVDLPPGVPSNSYVVQVEDTRGISVLASSYSEFTSQIAWNTTGFKPDLDYVDSANLNVLGTHSNFTEQQNGPNGTFDTLAEGASGTIEITNYPTNSKMYGATTLGSGSTNDLQVNDGGYMRFQAYPSSFSGSNTFGFTSVGSSVQSIEDTIRGSLFNVPNSGQAQSISVYLDLSYASNRRVKAAIYSEDHDFISETEEKIISSSGWYTFNFADPKPMLTANTNYILVAWSNSGTGSVSLRYNYGSSYQGHYRTNQYYGSWPGSIYFSHDTNSYSIYCNYSPVNQYLAQVELTGSSPIPSSWNSLVWTIDGSVSTSTVATTFQLYNSVTGQYPTSGDGFITTTLGTVDQTRAQTIVSNPASFLNSSGNWKIMVTAVKSTSSPFVLNLDFARYNLNVTNYAINLQEQWVAVNATNIRQDLCIKTGSMGAEPLLVQVLHGGNWLNLMTLAPNFYNNVSLAPYIDSSTLSIRFVGNNESTDPSQDTWNIDSIFIKDEPDVNFLVNLEPSTFTLELLQNGTMRWLGQNLQLATQTLPIPPIPVRAIHVNQTINGVNQEVPFQIEDWASNYQMPLGLTSNSTVFGNRQMIVFLLNSKVTDFTVWWDGSDTASQTPLAFTNNYFSDNVGSRTLNNGKLRLQFASTGFVLTSTVGSVTSTSNLMRINNNQDNTDPELAYVITDGVVRDIALGEAEFSNGITNCPNTYTNIVISLPANVNYYTYRLRTMFIDSESRTRTISDLCPVSVSTSASQTQMQTENGTLGGFPIIQNYTGTFSNYASSGWTAHHFSQLISDNGKGVGIFFTDTNNQKLYSFDSFSASTSKGALKVSSNLIELLPVSQAQVQFTYAYDISWQGAVATFDGNTPVCSLYDGTTPMGLWLLSEYPPTISVIAKN
jgi:hypothetical protein